MSGSSQRHPGILRARLEFPVWYRTFAKSYVAWANAPGDLKTPLLLQGQSLAQAEGWLLACPDRLSESQKRFVVRSIAQRAKEVGGQQPARDTTVKSQQKQKASSKWRRATDRNLLNLFGVIVIGMWFFLPDFMRDGLENALNTPDAYTDQRRSKVASAPPPSLSSDTENLDGAEDAISSAPVDGTGCASDHVDRLPHVSEVSLVIVANRLLRRHHVHIHDLVTMRHKLTNDGRARLAAASRHDDTFHNSPLVAAAGPHKDSRLSVDLGKYLARNTHTFDANRHASIDRDMMNDGLNFVDVHKMGQGSGTGNQGRLR